MANIKLKSQKLDGAKFSSSHNANHVVMKPKTKYCRTGIRLRVLRCTEILFSLWHYQLDKRFIVHTDHKSVTWPLRLKASLCIAWKICII